MRVVDMLRKKRDGGELTRDEIREFVTAAATGGWADYQLSAMLMAICTRGMTPAETSHLTRAMTDSGARVDLSGVPGVKVDKHSTGGVGDKTSLILAPLAAACGVVVPMMSGRGLGHTGGTLDKLEAIPGFRVNLTVEEFRAALRKTGCGMIGQTADVAPADRKLYALRDVTGTVESLPLITASILSKKLAEGITGLVVDVKCGRGAFMKNLPDARALAESIVRVGTANGLKVEAVMTGMDTPLGRMVGNSLEVIEAIETLKGIGPKDLTDLSVLLAAKMVRLGGQAGSDAEAEKKVREAIASGAGLEKLRRIIEQQGGDPRVVDDTSRLKIARRSVAVMRPAPGTLRTIDAEKVGIASMMLGAGRRTADDKIDHAVGVRIDTPVGEKTAKDRPVFTVFYNDDTHLKTAISLLEAACWIDKLGTPFTPAPLVLETVA